MKFRETFKWKWYQCTLGPAVLGVGFYLVAPYFFRIYSHRMIFYRNIKMVFAAQCTIMSWMVINSYPWSDKTIHDLITQPEPNGRYLRRTLKEQFPRNWALISKQLHEMGYNFKEMNEYSENIYMPDVTYKFDNSMY